MREGYYTDAYFNHARETLLADGRRPRVVMQVFQKKHAYLGGMDEAIAILKLCSHDWDGADRARALRRRRDRAVGDGDDDRGRLHALRAPRDALPRHARAADARSRRTSSRVLEAANGKPIIFMPARHDHHRVQTGDGYAAYVAGQVVGAPIGVTTDEQASWWGGKGIGTVPHALIARLRRQHGAGRDEVRRVGAGGPERHRARRLRERLGAAPRSRSPARSAPALGRPAGHVRVARRPLALGRDGRLQAHAGSTSGWSGRCGRRSTQTASSG